MGDSIINKNKEVAVSVIMPCLNVANYIKECIDSIVEQTIFDKIEVLIVDAGSVDGTKDIALSYASRYENICLFESSRKSYGFQVNYAMTYATGEYVAVVDTDDFLPREAFEELYQKAKELDVDIVKGWAYQYVVDDVLGELYRPSFNSEVRNRLFERELIVRENPSLFYEDWNLWNGIYRRAKIPKPWMNETKGAAFQDISAIYRILYCSESAYFIDKPVYYYRMDNENASTRNEKVFSFMEYEYGGLIKEYENSDVSWKKSLATRIYLHVANQLEMYATAGMDVDTVLSLADDLINMLRFIRIQKLLFGEVYEGNRVFFNLLCDDPKRAYETKLKYAMERKRTISEMKKMCANRRIIIFGAGTRGRYVHKILEKEYIKMENGKPEGFAFDRTNGPVGFCDNCSLLQGETIDNLSVYSLNETVHRFPDVTYVIAIKDNEEDVRKQLLSMNIREEKIYCYMFNTDIIVP